MKTPIDRITMLGRNLFVAQAEEDRLSKELKAVKEHIETMSVDLLQLMEDAEVTQHRLKGLGLIHLRNDFYASVLAADRPRLNEWLRENGFGDLITGYVHPQTFKAFAREQVDKNMPLPDFVKTFFKTSVVLNK